MLKASKTCREGFSFYHVGEEAVCSVKAVKCQKQLSDFLVGSYSEGGFQRFLAVDVCWGRIQGPLRDLRVTSLEDCSVHWDQNKTQLSPGHIVGARELSGS